MTSPNRAQAHLYYIPAEPGPSIMPIIRIRSLRHITALPRCWRQVSHPVPPHKIGAKEKFFIFFTQKTVFFFFFFSILSQLDGKEILNGILRVSLADTKETPATTIFWPGSKRDGVPSPDQLPICKLRKAFSRPWRAAGRSKQAFDQRLKIHHPAAVPSYARELMERAKRRDPTATSVSFFEMAAALPGEPGLKAIVCEAKTKEPPWKAILAAHPTGRLIYRLVEIGPPDAVRLVQLRKNRIISPHCVWYSQENAIFFAQDWYS